MLKNVLQLVFDPKNNHDTACFIEPRGNMIRKFPLSELAELVSLYARGMAASKIEPGRRIAIIAKTSLNSFIACLGNMLNGGINVIIPLDASMEEQQQALAESRAEFLIVEDFAHAQSVVSHIQYLPQLRQIIILNNSEFEQSPEILTLTMESVIECGRNRVDSTKDLIAKITPDDDAFIFFMRDKFQHLRPTCMTHADIVTYLHAIEHKIRRYLPAKHITSNEVKTLTVAPLHMPFTCIAGLFLPLMQQHSFTAVDRQDSWKSGNLPFRPNIVISESTFIEKLNQDVIEGIKADNSIMSNYLLSKIEKLANSQYRYAASDVNPNAPEIVKVALSTKSTASALFSQLLFSPIAQHQISSQIGGKLRLLFSVDNKPENDNSWMFCAAKIPILYGDLSMAEAKSHGKCNHIKAAA